jgi:hypothetical protein
MWSIRVEINVTPNLTELLSIEICGSYGCACRNYRVVGSDTLNFVTMKNSNFRLLISTFFVVQQSKSGIGHLIVKVSRSHTTRQTHPVGHLWTSDQLVADTAAYTTHNKHKRRTSTPSRGFEPAIPAIDWPQTHTLDRTALGSALTFTSFP